MANEAVLKVRLEDPIDFTIPDGVNVEKGACCFLTDPRTLSGSNASTNNTVPWGGIAAREKVASDGRTQLSAYKRGIFDMTITAGGAVVLGYPVRLSGANTITQANSADILSGSVIGRSLETGSTGEVIEVLVGGY